MKDPRYFLKVGPVGTKEILTFETNSPTEAIKIINFYMWELKYELENLYYSIYDRKAMDQIFFQIR